MDLGQITQTPVHKSHKLVVGEEVDVYDGVLICQYTNIVEVYVTDNGVGIPATYPHHRLLK